MKKQVDKSHYEFKKYLNKQRWASMWHQLDEILKFEPKKVLEIGPGPGVFKVICSQFGIKVETLDIDPELNPDHIALANEMPFFDNMFDVVCAFQMLEHVPYEKSLQVFSEMARVARKGIVISLPDARRVFPFAFYIPLIGLKWLHIVRPHIGRKKHLFDGEHCWEINTVGYPLTRISTDLQLTASVELLRTYRVHEHPYHRFFIFKKNVIAKRKANFTNNGHFL